MMRSGRRVSRAVSSCLACRTSQNDDLGQYSGRQYADEEYVGSCLDCGHGQRWSWKLNRGWLRAAHIWPGVKVTGEWMRLCGEHDDASSIVLCLFMSSFMQAFPSTRSLASPFPPPVPAYHRRPPDRPRLPLAADT